MLGRYIKVATLFFSTILLFLSLPATIGQEPRCSRTGDVAATLTFVNRTNRTVDVYWIDYECKEQLWFTLAPGQRINQDTFVTHVWLVRDTRSDDELIRIVSTEPSETVEIRDEGNPGPAVTATLNATATAESIIEVTAQSSRSNFWSVEIQDVHQEQQFAFGFGLQETTYTANSGFTFLVVEAVITENRPNNGDIESSAIAIIGENGEIYSPVGRDGSAGAGCLECVWWISPTGDESTVLPIFLLPQVVAHETLLFQFRDAPLVPFSLRAKGTATRPLPDTSGWDVSVQNARIDTLVSGDPNGGDTSLYWWPTSAESVFVIVEAMIQNNAPDTLMSLCSICSAIITPGEAVVASQLVGTRTTGYCDACTPYVVSENDNAVYEFVFVVSAETIMNSAEFEFQLQTMTVPFTVEVPENFGNELQATVESNTRINLRYGPGSEYKVADGAEPNTSLTAIGRNKAGDWLQFKTDGNERAWAATFLFAVKGDINDLPVLHD